MKTIVAVHGNPGHPEDWDEIKKYLPKEYKLIAVDGYAENLTETLSQIPGPFTLVGYSFGAQTVLRSLDLLKDKVQEVLLISPFLNSSKPLSGVTKFLLRLPALGDKLIEGSRRKSHKSFLENMISPQKMGDNPYYQKMSTRLQNPELWKRTVHKKIQAEASPFTVGKATSVPIKVLWGAEDKTMDIPFQKAHLSGYTHVKEITLKNAGHGIIWAQATEVVRELTETKIGYYPGKDTRNNVINYLESHLRNFPERKALKWVRRGSLEVWDKTVAAAFPHDEVSYVQFAQRISAFANGLKKIGVAPGDRIIIFLPMSLDMYVAMFAVQRIGAISVFLDSWARSHHLGATAKCVDPKGMVSFKQAFDLVDQVPEFSTMPLRIMYGPGDNFTHKFDELLIPGECPIEPVESETTSLITFTTGSTGTPKGANRTHRFLSAQHHALSHVIPYEAQDIDLPIFPIFSLNNLATGVTTVLPGLNLAAPSEMDPIILVNQLLHQNVNCATLSPSQLAGVSNYCISQNIKLNQIKRVVTGGAPISRDDVEKFYKVSPQADLWVLYGSTEAEPMAHIEGRDMLKEKTNVDAEIVEEGVNVGHISDDVDFKFVKLVNGPIKLTQSGWAGSVVPMGEVGEFICTGDHVCRDYYNNPEAFISAKIQDPDGRVWHRTGDLGYIDSDKNLWLVGRVNNAIVRDQKYYFPVKSEIILKRFGFTHRCAFFGLPDQALGEKTCVAVELKPSLEGFSVDLAKEQIRAVFAKNKTPIDEIFFVKSVPMDPRHHSKVEYSVLKNLLREPGEILG